MLMDPRPGATQNSDDPHREQNPREGPSGSANHRSDSSPEIATASRTAHVIATALPCQRRQSTQWHTTTGRSAPVTRYATDPQRHRPPLTCQPGTTVRPVPRKVFSESSCASHHGVWWIGASVPVHGDEKPRSR